MIDNIFLLQELLRKYGRKRISPQCVLRWIMTCIFTTYYSLSYNGSLHGFFKGKRGLRQGDPLSPYLFVLCLEYLSRGLGELQLNADFNFHPKCGGLKITHLAFADDLVLFSKGDTTFFYSAGISSMDMEAIKGITGFSQGSFPFKYLGIPADSRLSIFQFSPLIDKISGYISAWVGANLSYAGRTELVKSVLQGVECFWLSILPIPAGVRAKIDQLCRNFLWSGKCNENKRPLVAWKEVSLPKIEGGLGIRNSKAWNKALLSKTLWDIQAKKDSLWGTVEEAIQRLNQWTSNEELQSKLTYGYLRSRSAKLTWPKLVWHSSITPKHSFMLWLGLKDCLLTKDKLQGFTEDQVCPLCKLENETTNHLFFQCRVEARGTGLQAKAKKICLACPVYHLWEARNQRIFDGKINHPKAIIRRIQIQIYRSIYSLSQTQ
ncbi:hypothetical protein Acr_00g0034340 [Actinidia rufa]|uniref:Reverse transcriptase domain-containing protein n=1 Tax=Actinidia rufa TaxID=165716 RepID=A0A7J0DFX1_9ERIC|nr:hypothetical protein Acr_00g0034340 [Actinidia rufa]